MNQKLILIIDDHKAFRELLVELQIASFNVIDAENGEQGLHLSLGKHPDLILLDLAMPVMNGPTMLERLHENNWGKTAKVVILSNLDDTGKFPIAGPDRKGIYKYITKADVSMEQLVEEMKSILK